MGTARPTAATVPRLTTRIPPELLKTLEEAAQLVGASLNGFVVEAALEKARQLIDQERVIHAGAETTLLLTQLLNAPLPVNAPLAQLLSQAQTRRKQDDGTTHIAL